MRCKACNNILKPREEYVNKKTNKLEELCGVCRSASFSSESSIDPVEETIDSIEDSEEASKTLDESGQVW